jgi:hypothetical protein
MLNIIVFIRQFNYIYEKISERYIKKNLKETLKKDEEVIGNLEKQKSI